MIIYQSSEGNYSFAKSLKDAGLNVIPMRCDGSKRPRINWQQFIEYPCPWRISSDLFISKGRPSGIGIICGMTSGNLEVLDFDDPSLFAPWSALVDPALLARLPIVQTPKDGRHVYWRCETIAESQKLAMAPSESDDKLLTLIETRGQGGLVVSVGSPLSVHPTGKPYLLLQGDLLNVPTIAPEQRERMLAAARSFDRTPTVAKIATDNTAPAAIANSLPTLASKTAAQGDRPGDDFAAQTSWEQILEPHGWNIMRRKGETTYWRKPGSSSNEHHATTGFGEAGQFHVFSTATGCFEAGRTYGKFATYALLNNAGDFSAAASDLAAAGFGKQTTVLTFEFEDFYGAEFML